MRSRRSDAAGAEALVDLFTRMCRLRAAEEVVAAAYARGDLPGLLHLAIGAEGITVGVTAQLTDDDRLYSAHRPHAHFLAAGVSEYELFAELAGREEGLCRGRGGSMHLMADVAVLATGVVGGSLPIALGHALCVSAGAVSVVFFGDGAVQTGGFHETLNMAALWKAPVLFVCENNGWAEFTERAEHTPVDHVVDYASVYRIASAQADGRDVEAVAAAAKGLLADVRAGGGPAILECGVTRIRPHYEGDLRRLSQSTDPENDPLEVLAARLAAAGQTTDAIDAIRTAALDHAEREMTRALAGTHPSAADDAALVFAAPYR